MARVSREAPPAVAALDEERKAISRQIGERKARGEPVDDLIERSRALSARIAELSEEQQAPVGGRDEGRYEWRTDVLTELGQVRALRDEWRDLLAQSEANSPFLTWEWMVSWYETFEDEGRVRCVAVRDGGGELVGIAPLFVAERRDAKLGRRQVGFASTYGPAWGCYLELIHTPAGREAVARATARYLRDSQDEWDGARFLRVPGETESMLSLVRSMVSMGWHTAVRPSEPGPVLVVPEGQDDVVAAFASPGLRRNCRSAMRRLAAEHPRHAFRLCGNAEELEERIEQLAALNVERRAELPRHSNFLRPKYRVCLARALRRFWEAGWLRVPVLEIEGEVVGVAPFLLYRGACYLLSSGWAPEYGPYALGHVLFARAAELSVREGAREVHFLPGGGYKSHYTRRSKDVFDIVAWRSRLGMTRSVVGEACLRALNRAKRLGRRGD